MPTLRSPTTGGSRHLNTLHTVMAEGEELPLHRAARDPSTGLWPVGSQSGAARGQHHRAPPVCLGTQQTQAQNFLQTLWPDWGSFLRDSLGWSRPEETSEEETRREEMRGEDS